MACSLIIIFNNCKKEVNYNKNLLIQNDRLSVYTSKLKLWYDSNKNKVEQAQNNQNIKINSSEISYPLLLELFNLINWDSVQISYDDNDNIGLNYLLKKDTNTGEIIKFVSMNNNKVCNGFFVQYLPDINYFNKYGFYTNTNYSGEINVFNFKTVLIGNSKFINGKKIDSNLAINNYNKIIPNDKKPAPPLTPAPVTSIRIFIDFFSYQFSPIQLTTKINNGNNNESFNVNFNFSAILGNSGFPNLLPNNPSDISKLDLIGIDNPDPPAKPKPASIKFKISEDFKKKYPKTTKFIQDTKLLIDNNSELKKSILKFSGMTEEQLNNTLIDGSGPKVQVGNLWYDYDATFDKETNTITFNLNSNYISNFENALSNGTNSIEIASLGAFIYLNLFHETIHYGNYINNIQDLQIFLNNQILDMGDLWEIYFYGENIQAPSGFGIGIKRKKG